MKAVLFLCVTVKLFDYSVGPKSCLITGKLFVGQESCLIILWDRKAVWLLCVTGRLFDYSVGQGSCLITLCDREAVWLLSVGQKSCLITLCVTGKLFDYSVGQKSCLITPCDHMTWKLFDYSVGHKSCLITLCDRKAVWFYRLEGNCSITLIQESCLITSWAWEWLISETGNFFLNRKLTWLLALSLCGKATVWGVLL